MGYERIKGAAKSLGLYRAARWVHQHILDRRQLQELKSELHFYGQFIRPGDLCFDVGANYGTKSDVFLRLGARVVAFEPQPDCAAEMRSRLGRNPHLTIVNAAVSSEAGQATLFVHPDRACSSLVAGWEGPAEGSICVPVTTLDDAIAKFGVPRYLKIDVEGFEEQVLKGLSQPIDTVSFEYHVAGNGIEQAIACVNLLRRFGPLTANIFGAYHSTFVREEWWSIDAFLDYLRHDLPHLNGYGYGDVFVRHTR